MPLPPGLLADFQAAQNNFMPDMATIARTGLSFPCRVDAEIREYHLDGLPRSLPLRKWRIILPSAAGIKSGDSIAVPTRGTFSALDTAATQTSYSPSNVAYCVLAREADGSLPLPTNYTVSFRQRANGAPVIGPYGVFIIPTSVEAQLSNDGFSFTHQVIFDEGLTFPPDAQSVRQPISQGDHILWTGIKNGFAILSHPQVHVFPVPFSTAYFKEA